MSPTINAKVSDYFFATSRVFYDHSVNFSSSLYSLPKLVTTLIAVKVSSAIPPSYLTTFNLSKVDYLTFIPKTTKIIIKNGR